MNRSVMRYLLALVTRSHRLVAPMTLYVLLVLIFNTDPGPPIETYATTAALLFPVACWLAVSVLGAEDAPLAAATAATVGGPVRLRMAKSALTCALVVPLAGFAVVLPAILRNFSTPLTADAVAAGAIAHLLVAIAGVAVGTAVATPVVQRSGIAFLVVAAATLAELLIPHAPPVRSILEHCYDGSGHHVDGELARIIAETLPAAALITLGGSVLARRAG